MSKPPDTILLMKVGNHAGESFEQILERKNEEYRRAGRIFWGYGGSACHPLKQVQPFVKLHVEKGGHVLLVLQEIDSRANPTVLPATEYSEDGRIWKPLPEGVNVTGSRFALVLDEIKPADFEISTQEYVIGIGPSSGKTAEEYLRGHVDKACLIRSTATKATMPRLEPKKVKYAAQLVEPYAVLVRHGED